MAMGGMGEGSGETAMQAARLARFMNQTGEGGEACMHAAPHTPQRPQRLVRGPPKPSRATSHTQVSAQALDSRSTLLPAGGEGVQALVINNNPNREAGEYTPKLIALLREAGALVQEARTLEEVNAFATRVLQQEVRPPISL